MPWPKPSAELTQLLERILSGLTGGWRIIFGAPTWFMNGNMFAGVFGDSVFIRLIASDLKEVFALPGVERFEPMKGSAMKEYADLFSEFLEEGNC